MFAEFFAAIAAVGYLAVGIGIAVGFVLIALLIVREALGATR